MPRKAGSFSAISRSCRAGPRRFAVASDGGGASVPAKRCTPSLKRLASLFRRGLVYWLPLALLLAMVLAHVAIPKLFDRFSLFAFDLYQSTRPRQTPDEMPVLIVDIDEQSLKEIGQWPWPRTVLAQLVDKLNEAGAAVIAFDVLFTEPDRTSRQLL